MNKFFSLLKRNKSTINYISFIFLFVYYLLAFLPSFQTINSYESLLITNSILSLVYKIFVFLLYVCITFCCFVSNDLKLDFQIIFICVFYLFFSFVSIFLFGNGEKLLAVDGQTFIPLDVGFKTKISALLVPIRNAFVIFSIIGVYSKISKRIYVLFLIKLFLLYSLFVIIYSCIFEWNKIISLFINSSGYSSEITSIFTNKNAFGVFIFSIAMLLLVYNKMSKFRHKSIYIFSYYAFLIIFSFLIYCRTTSLVLTFVLLIYFYLYLASGKEIQQRKTIITIITVSIFSLVLFIILFNCIPSFRNTFVGKIISSYTNSLLSSLFDGNGRLEIWVSYIRYLLNPITIVLGYGDTISNTALQAITSVNSYQYLQHSAFHNGVIQIMASGGLLRIGVYLYLVYKYSYLTIKKSNIKNVLVVALVGFSLYQSFESLILLTSDYQTWILTLLLFVFPPTFKKKYVLGVEEQYIVLNI